MLSDFVLENKFAKASFKSKGAELCSFIYKKTGKEYIWQADPEVWNRHAPILFPIVGKLKEDTYIFDRKTYQMSQHGFARDLVFDVESHSKEELKFVLTYSEKTYKQFPFKFKLFICYELKETVLNVSYEVFNEDKKPIYFSIGAHPAFRCPLSEGEQFEDYYLEFNETETLERYLLTDGAFNGQKEIVMENTHKLPLSYDLFDRDAIVFKKFKSNNLTLKSNKGPYGVKMTFPGFPYLGIWTKTKGAPFICLEPWYGLGDAENTSGELVEKEGIMNLNAGEDFDCHYKIEIF